MPAAVIFDFDGVIVDTEPLHHEAFNRVLAPYGLGFSWPQYVERIIGFDDRDAFREVFGEAGRPLSEELLAELIAAKARTFHDVVRGGVSPFPGVLALIEDVASKVPIALCSGALRSDIEAILPGLQLTARFGVIVTADDVPVSKPDPAPYRLAFDSLQNAGSSPPLQPGSTLAIEDTPTGIASARGAGLLVLGVTNSYPAAELHQAHRVVDSLAGVEMGDLNRMFAGF